MSNNKSPWYMSLAERASIELEIGDDETISSVSEKDDDAVAGKMTEEMETEAGRVAEIYARSGKLLFDFLTDEQSEKGLNVRISGRSIGFTEVASLSDITDLADICIMAGCSLLTSLAIRIEQEHDDVDALMHMREHYAKTSASIWCASVAIRKKLSDDQDLIKKLLEENDKDVIVSEIKDVLLESLESNHD